MSTNYYLNDIGFDFEALKTEGHKVGMTPIKNKKNSENAQCYRCGKKGHIRAYKLTDGSVSFCRYGLSTGEAENALQDLADAIEAELLDEHELLDLEDELDLEEDSDEDVLEITKILKVIPS